MKNLLGILLVMLLSPQMAKAQISFDPGEGCLNVVDFSAGKGFGESGGSIISAYYLHERLINEQFSAGVGVGYAHLNSYKFSAVPLFFSTHYFFLDQRFSPFVNLRAGIYWPLRADNIQPGARLYLAPYAGLKVHITPYIGMLASVGYDGYLVKAHDSVKNSYQTKMASNLCVSVGVCFQIPGW